MEDFCNLYNFKNLVKEPTCYKNPSSPSCIDLIFTNKPMSFQHTIVIETGISDFLKMTASVLKTMFKKQPPTIKSYRGYSNYSHTLFRAEIEGVLSCYGMNISNDDFVSMCMTRLNEYAPIKHRYVRANDNEFVTKDLRKAIMKRSRLRNLYNKYHSDESKMAYKKQRKIFVLLW